MVSAFHPEAMAETVRRAEVRELHACATAAMPDPQALRSRPRL